MKGVLKFFAGILVGIGVTLLTAWLVLPGKLFTVAESRLGFEETADAIVESAEFNKWTISHIYDLQATMKKNGYEVPPVYVFSLCNPGHASNILKSDDDRLVSAVMPCRVSVFEKDGKTYISMLNTSLLAPLLSKNTKQTLSETTRETLNVLKPVIQ